MDDTPIDINNRDIKKEKLKERVIDTPMEDYSSRLRKHRIIRWSIAAAAVVIVIVAGVLWLSKKNTKYFDGVQVASEKSVGMNGDCGYLAFGENLIAFNRSDIKCIDGEGETVWMQSCEMGNPICDSCGDYAVVADQGANTIYIFDKKGCTGKVSTALPITRISIASQGMVAAILEDEIANYITVYTKEGSKLDIEIKTVISEDGYPLDIDLSPSGESLMVSYVGLEGDSLAQKVCFYNFTVGQDRVDKLIGGFEHYENTVIPKVGFFDNESSVAVGDDRITFYSFATESEVAIGKEIPITELHESGKIEKLVQDERYLTLVFKNVGKDTASTVIILDKKGEKVCEESFDIAFDSLQIAENEILIYNQSIFEVYYFDGSMKFSQSLNSRYDVVLPAIEKNQYNAIGQGQFCKLKAYTE